MPTISVEEADITQSPRFLVFPKLSTSVLNTSGYRLFFSRVTASFRDRRSSKEKWKLPNLQATNGKAGWTESLDVRFSSGSWSSSRASRGHTCTGICVRAGVPCGPGKRKQRMEQVQNTLAVLTDLAKQPQPWMLQTVDW